MIALGSFFFIFIWVGLGFLLIKLPLSWLRSFSHFCPSNSLPHPAVVEYVSGLRGVGAFLLAGVDPPLYAKQLILLREGPSFYSQLPVEKTDSQMRCNDKALGKSIVLC